MEMMLFRWLPSKAKRIRFEIVRLLCFASAQFWPLLVGFSFWLRFGVWVSRSLSMLPGPQLA